MTRPFLSRGSVPRRQTSFPLEEENRPREPSRARNLLRTVLPADKPLLSENSGSVIRVEVRQPLRGERNRRPECWRDEPGVLAPASLVFCDMGQSSTVSPNLQRGDLGSEEGGMEAWEYRSTNSKNFQLPVSCGPGESGCGVIFGMIHPW
ncbi:hypothetical protein K466DRAFT_582681 [Polyporus arcularius HHB13444]|uniref:Uncharacterized protein n=1 Tax=Polyporus arcularius HHB13444 TaxID=1314778 RepID=A0A5C3PPC5_9APHY|nr:hypothetical protein K466DRAFT_582681 [Polyporus arcularius HHB13444]